MFDSSARCAVHILSAGFRDADRGGPGWPRASGRSGCRAGLELRARTPTAGHRGREASGPPPERVWTGVLAAAVSCVCACPPSCLPDPQRHGTSRLSLGLH